MFGLTSCGLISSCINILFHLVWKKKSQNFLALNQYSISCKLLKNENSNIEHYGDIRLASSLNNFTGIACRMRVKKRTETLRKP